MFSSGQDLGASVGLHGVMPGQGLHQLGCICPACGDVCDAGRGGDMVDVVERGPMPDLDTSSLVP